MILSLDIGSSSVRALLFDARGAQVQGAEARRPSALRQTPDGGVEADADAILALLAECIDEVLGKARDLPRPNDGAPGRGAVGIDGVALSTFWHSLLGVSKEGRPVTPLFTLGDCRSGAAAERLAAMVDPEETHQRTGCILHPSYPPAKLLWLRETRPEAFGSATWWCSIGEYIQFRLFGRRQCSPSMASGTGLWNRLCRKWDPEILGALGVTENHLSSVAGAEEPFSGLAPSFAERWPLLRSVPWFPALADGACSNIGCGCAGPSRAAVMIGTTGAMRIALREAPPRVPAGLWCYSVDRDRPLVGGALSNGGDLHNWMIRTLRIDMTTEALEAALLERSPESHGLTVLPFLSGERSPGWISGAHAAVLGIDGGTTPLDILQAGMEAIAYRFAAIWRLLREAAPGVTQIVGTGGALNASRAWTRMIADVLDTPVTLSRAPEASSRGAALLALEALGAIGRVEDADPLFGETIEPRGDRRGSHAAAMRRLDDYYKRVCVG